VIINIQREKKIFIDILKLLLIMRINYKNFVTVFYTKIKIGWKNYNKQFRHRTHTHNSNAKFNKNKWFFTYIIFFIYLLLI